jgi:MerR family copper efflux transcriptional regulator
MNIRDAAAASGLSAKTIRYYEEVGLLPAPVRDGNGYRNYDHEDVALLQLLRHARELGFSIGECRDLIGFYRDPMRASREVKSLVVDKIAAIDRRLIELRAVRAELVRLSATCRGDDDPECAILDELAKAE